MFLTWRGQGCAAATITEGRACTLKTWRLYTAAGVQWTKGHEQSQIQIIEDLWSTLMQRFETRNSKFENWKSWFQGAKRTVFSRATRRPLKKFGVVWQNRVFRPKKYILVPTMFWPWPMFLTMFCNKQNIALGKDPATKSDEFSEKFQTVLDPHPRHFGKFRPIKTYMKLQNLQHKFLDWKYPFLPLGSFP